MGQTPTQRIMAGFLLTELTAPVQIQSTKVRCPCLTACSLPRPCSSVWLSPPPPRTLPPHSTKNSPSAVRLKLKDNRGALDNATDAADSPEKHLIAGVAAYRLEEWVNAAELLGKAAKELPLVADYPLFWELMPCIASHATMKPLKP